jgi:hypothetical protein
LIPNPKLELEEPVIESDAAVELLFVMLPTRVPAATKLFRETMD